MLLAQRALGKPLEQAHEGDDRPFAVRDDIDLGLWEVAVKLFEHVVEDLEELPAIIFKLGDYLDVVQVVVQELLEVELEEPGLVGKEGDAVGDDDALNQLLDDLFEALIVILGPGGEAGVVRLLAKPKPLHQGSCPLLGFLEDVLVGGGNWGTLAQ